MIRKLQRDKAYFRDFGDRLFCDPDLSIYFAHLQNLIMSNPLPYFSADDIAKLLSYDQVVAALRIGFTKDYVIPPRMHLNYENNPSAPENTLLLMPAVSSGEVAGVKIVTVAPDNSSKDLPTIQGIYYLLDAQTGTPKCLMEAKTLTNWRTAGASALASSYLSRTDSQTLLMIGTGSLSPFLIDAHASQRAINRLLVYGRSKQKAEALAESKSDKIQNVEVVHDLEEAVGAADIISAATISKEPLIKGEWLKPGQHIDLVGSYRPDMREADNEVIRRSRVFVDTIGMAPKETGDLAVPIAEGILSLGDIQGDLFGLCKGEVSGRNGTEEITLFKSVGHALEDLVTAQLLLKLNQSS